MTSAVRMLIGLAAGLVAGAAAGAFEAGLPRAFTVAMDTVGTIFINAIRMTVIPLVVAKIIVGVASATDDRSMTRIGGSGLAIFVIAVVLACSLSLAVGVPAMARFPIDAGVAASFRAGAAEAAGNAVAGATGAPSFARWFVDLIPANPFKAAADGAMLPLIVFSLALGFAMTRVPSDRRRLVIDLLQGLAEALLTVVRWVLAVAPFGVFALAVPLAARLGIAAAGALLYYVLMVAAGCVVFALLVIYPAAVLGGGLRFGRFARSVTPAQAIAFSSRSSLASLPVMMEVARSRLGLREEVVGFLLPLAAAMFRAGTAVGFTMGVLFLARLYGVDLGPPAYLSIVLTILVTSLGSPGVPSGSILVIVPVLMAAGIPVEGVGILLGIDTLPDMFRTTANITADIAAAAIVNRRVFGSPATET